MTHHETYLRLYDQMIDPDISPSESSTSQRLMTRRYDVVPFAGHDVTWDATQYAKILYEAIMSHLTGAQSLSPDISMIHGVMKWSTDHHLPLVVVKDGNYPEQVMYRLGSLVRWTASLFADQIDRQYQMAHYEAIDELIMTKRHGFWFWTSKYALWDGAKIAISSGLLGWMGSYLRNWSVVGSTALAAGP